MHSSDCTRNNYEAKYDSSNCKQNAENHANNGQRNVIEKSVFQTCPK